MISFSFSLIFLSSSGFVLYLYIKCFKSATLWRIVLGGPLDVILLITIASNSNGLSTNNSAFELKILGIRSGGRSADLALALLYYNGAASCILDAGIRICIGGL